MYFSNPSELPIGQNSKVLLFPVLSDIQLHRCQNRISFVYVQNLDTGEWGIVNHHHCDYNDCHSEWLSEYEFPRDAIAYNSAVFKNFGLDFQDAELKYWLYHGKQISEHDLYSQNLQCYHRWHYRNDWANDVIPITIHIDWIQKMIDKFGDAIIDGVDGYEFYHSAMRNFQEIGDSELPIDFSIYGKFYDTVPQKIYSNYNIFTTTGRPSNAFGGINLAALPKDTGIRAMIHVESKDEILIEFDYQSYHVRLVSQLMGYELPNGNLHEYFGRQYFDSETLTAGQYEESKAITFALLYGSMKNSYHSIPFFERAKTFINRMWKAFNRNGYIKMPLSGRKLRKGHFDGMTSNKLFNYLIQAHETETNSLMLRDIIAYLYNKKSRLILYTYDSFLFRFHRDDGTECIEGIRNILISKGIPVSVSWGKNYDNMKKIISYD